MDTNSNKNGDTNNVTIEDVSKVVNPCNNAGKTQRIEQFHIFMYSHLLFFAEY